MVIFHSYVSLPEGNINEVTIRCQTNHASSGLALETLQWKLLQLSSIVSLQVW